MTADVRIRRMTPADLDQVVALAASLKDAPHWTRSAYVEALRPDATLKRIALVAETSSGLVVGFVVASLLPPQAELESICVSSAQQRRGLGRNLFAVLVSALNEADGVEEVLLEVRSSNRAALDFYRATGWIEAGRRPRYYAEPEEDAFLMRLNIA